SFLRKGVLKAVAEFIVCGDQSLAVADNAVFRNCLVAMQPVATKSDLPTMHDVCMFIHNSFVDFLEWLKADIQVFLLVYLPVSRSHFICSLLPPARFRLQWISGQLTR
ncbi:hypothetical protein OG21DRAFT_1428745, partial [Imleria badia]